MITELKSLKKQSIWLTELINQHFSYDFYYTENNARVFITDVFSFKKFFKSCMITYITKDQEGDYTGIIMVWKSVGGGKNRYYVKLIAKSPKDARDLLTVLVWNSKETLFTKIRKDSKFLSAFKQKGFRFMGGRGCQILLKRRPIKEELSKET